MFRIATVHNILALRAVRSSRAGRMVKHEFTVLQIAVRPRLLVTSLPAAESNDTVELIPTGKGIVSSMVYDHTAATLYVVKKCGIRLCGPAVAVVVEHHHVVCGEIGFEVAHIAARGRRQGYVHIEQARLLKD